MIGFQKTVVFFSRRHKLGGTVCFLLGIVLVFLRWPIVGMLIEIFGILLLHDDVF